MSALKPPPLDLKPGWESRPIDVVRWVATQTWLDNGALPALWIQMLPAGLVRGAGGFSWWRTESEKRPPRGAHAGAFIHIAMVSYARADAILFGDQLDRFRETGRLEAQIQAAIETAADT
jgi:hypothetical protein